MLLVVISLISLIISGILTYIIDDILTSKHKFNWFWQPIADGTIFCIIYTILAIMLILGI